MTSSNERFAKAMTIVIEQDRAIAIAKTRQIFSFFTRFSSLNYEEANSISQEKRIQLHISLNHIWHFVKQIFNKYDKSNQVRNIIAQYDFTKVANVETYVWMSELIMNESMMTLSFLFQKIIEHNKKMKTWLNNQAYQRVNIDDVFRLLDIENFNVLKISSMSFNMTLKWFQSIAIKVMIDFENNNLFRECVLTNIIDLKKTIIVLRFFFW